MAVYLIAGMPAAGKDTLAGILSSYTNTKVVSMSKDVLIPLIQDKAFRKELSEKAKIDLSGLDFNSYLLSREGLIKLGDDLNSVLKSWQKGYYHFCDLAYSLYSESIIVPSFRQKRMLFYLEDKQIVNYKILIECSKEIRYRRWALRDNISEKEMEMLDLIEFSKYIQPLLREVKFDYTVDNSGQLCHLEDFAKSVVSNE